MPTASEICLASANHFAADLIDNAVREAKVFNIFEALPMHGTSFDSLVLKTDAAAGGFLRRGQGYARTAGTLVKGKVNAARMGFLVQEPKSTTLEFDRNLAKSGINSPGWLQLQARGRFLSEIAYAEQQIFTGTTNDALGYLGLKEICSYVSGNLLTTTDDAITYSFDRSVVNAGGVTASVASSVYSVNMGPQAVHLRIGGENGIAGFLKLGEVKEQFVADTEDATRQQTHYLAECEGYIGLNVGGSSEAYADRTYKQRDVRRLANLTVLVPLTQALLDTLYDSHPDGHKPNVFFMSRRSRRQLRDDMSNVVTRFFNMSPGDAHQRVSSTRFALPDDFNGIPIVETMRITDTQSIET